MDDEERRLLASTFDLDAEGYDQGRPDYPAEAWDIVLRHAAVVPGSVVVEVGPGTGQATRRLLAAGANVHAVEPGAALADTLIRRFAGQPLAVQNCAFEQADITDASVDAFCSATAFHWVDPRVGIPIARRILKPGAPVCLWWNVYRDPANESGDPVDALVRGATALPNVRGLNGILDELDLPARLADAGFVDVERRVVRWTGVHDEASLIALFRSFSDMRKRPAHERDRVLGRLRMLVRAHGGQVSRAYTTPIVLARAPGR